MISRQDSGTSGPCPQHVRSLSGRNIDLISSKASYTDDFYTQTPWLEQWHMQAGMEVDRTPHHHIR
ncbi:hypothetical protein M404DRAFT_1001297 [Pisolithus tinctorius Marx 270]|uniref:Uncharacterized protein n=1 Tax=Pisolithus tinctorius Marx 270 TaxID=870435 RepID=A0A0C3K1I8_PISTI|nr:hypothetical protein M404DRAFT_1001297 [Pisolithus tinctorius Marx 270]